MKIVLSYWLFDTSQNNILYFVVKLKSFVPNFRVTNALSPIPIDFVTQYSIIKMLSAKSAYSVLHEYRLLLFEEFIFIIN